MNPAFSPSLAHALRCPKRFHKEKIQRERTSAPFASSVLGRAVHEYIATSLRNGSAATEPTFRLPRRVLLQEGESLENLTERAHNAVKYFNGKCRVWLYDKNIKHVEHYISRPYDLYGSVLLVSGILDLVLSGPKGDILIDWKTGSAGRSADQLKFYLMLRYLETGRRPRHAEAVPLGGGEPLCISWDGELEVWFEAKLEHMRRDFAACSTREAVPGFHCTYCPYAHGCEVSEAPKRYMLDTFMGELKEITAYG